MSEFVSLAALYLPLFLGDLPLPSVFEDNALFSSGGLQSPVSISFLMLIRYSLTHSLIINTEIGTCKFWATFSKEER